ncbi:MAG: Tol-Pal system protein TolB, partial [Aestuariivirga sp.]
MKKLIFPVRAALGQIAVLLALLMLVAAKPAVALEVDVSGGRINPLPIAISPFLAGGGAEDAGSTISGVIANNLAKSGYFSPLPPESFIEQITDFNQEPRFADWRQIRAK